MNPNWARRGLAFGGLAATAALLHAAGGVLATPPLEPTDLVDWWTSEGPVIAMASMLRLAALLGSCWLAAVTALDSVAVAARMHPLQRLTRRVAPVAWRNLVLRPIALSAVAVPQVFVPVATTSAAAAEPVEVTIGSSDDGADETGPGEGVASRRIQMREVEPPPMAVMSLAEAPPAGRNDGADSHHDDDIDTEEGPAAPDAHRTDETPAEADAPPESPPESAPRSAPTPGREQATFTSRVPRSETAPATRTISMTLHEPITPPQETTATPQTRGDALHVVTRGESLWSIAADHLATERGAPVEASEVASYWQDLIETNRQALPDPDNPDLLYRGVELRLPPTG